MTDKLKNYLEGLFAAVPDTQEVREAKDELYDSMVERYEDCLREGMDEQAAYDTVVDSIGDIRELIDELDLGEDTAGAKKEKAQGAKVFGGFDLNAFVNNITDYATGLVSGFIHSIPPGEMQLVHSMSLPLQGVTSVDIGYVSESITVHQGDADTLVVNEYMNRDDAALFGEATITGGSISVKNGRRSGYFGLRSRIEVWLPPEWDGSLSLGTISGNISSDRPWNLTSLRARTVSGEIDFSSVVANLIHLSTTSGCVRLQQATGQLDLHTVSGSIKAGAVQGGGTFGTTSGGIRVTFVRLESAVKASSVSGGVRLGFPADASFELEAKTLSGSVHTAFDNLLTFEKRSRAHGFVGTAPYHHVRATSSSGGIHIND